MDNIQNKGGENMDVAIKKAYSDGLSIEDDLFLACILDDEKARERFLGQGDHSDEAIKERIDEFYDSGQIDYVEKVILKSLCQKKFEQIKEIFT